MHRDQLARHLDALLGPERYRDYCPNGLQVEGREDVRVVASGVSASLDLLERAVATGADAVFVHHGWFWRDEDRRVTGARRARIAFALAHGLNLFAYHLPLDAHPELGNNAQLARRLDLVETARVGEQALLCTGHLAVPETLAAFGARTHTALGRVPLLIGDAGRRVERVAWCTGGAQSMFHEAIALGVDAFVTGEISEWTVHAARESGVAYVAAGHHATERYGVQAVGEHLAAAFGLEHHYLELDNPV